MRESLASTEVIEKKIFMLAVCFKWERESVRQTVQT